MNRTVNRDIIRSNKYRRENGEVTTFPVLQQRKYEHPKNNIRSPCHLYGVDFSLSPMED